eukprot:TRINITY_DN3161_c0_g1_i10.p1 TRINITY_DN3161_c0_g1~~TRINITY_DN3161_c0_g1_i10.p1  ORF type:complete len:661 (-),score=36.00 TRINITY_DN3161_c0_g1_i10:153-2135(-)
MAPPRSSPYASPNPFAPLALDLDDGPAETVCVCEPTAVRDDDRRERSHVGRDTQQTRRDRYPRRTGSLQKLREQVAHHKEGNPSSAAGPSNCPSGVTTPGFLNLQNGCHYGSALLELRRAVAVYERKAKRNPPAAWSEGRFFPKRSRGWMQEHCRRPIASLVKEGRLHLIHGYVQPNLLHDWALANHRRFCLQAQSEGKALLDLQGKCARSNLVRAVPLHQSAVVTVHSGCSQTTGRAPQGGDNYCSPLASCAVVEASAGARVSTCYLERKRHLFELQVGTNAATHVEDVSVCSFARRFREVIEGHDETVKYRLELLEEMQINGDIPFYNAEDLRRSISQESSRARYDDFLDTGPLYDWAVKLSQESEDVASLRTAAIVLTRLTTMARSADIATALPYIEERATGFYIKFRDKSNTFRVLRVAGNTLAAISKYIKAAGPGDRLFHSLNGGNGLSADRISNLVKDAMQKAGIPTDLYKPHAIRGMAVSQAIHHGVPERLVQQRAGWRTTSAMDANYARCHQRVDWDSKLAGPAGTTLDNAVVVSAAAKTKETEVEPSGYEGGSTVSEAKLAAAKNTTLHAADPSRATEPLTLVERQHFVMPQGTKCAYCTRTIKCEQAIAALDDNQLPEWYHMRCVETESEAPAKKRRVPFTKYHCAASPQ